MKEGSFKKKLTVTACDELASWPNSKGTAETVLYEIKARDEDGRSWEPRPLRSFALLEIGVLFEYDVEPYRNPRTGEESMTLRRPRQNTTQRVAYLEKQMEDVLDRLSAAEAALSRIPRQGERPLGDSLPGQWQPGLGGKVG